MINRDFRGSWASAVKGEGKTETIFGEVWEGLLELIGWQNQSCAKTERVSDKKVFR